ncbi:MAG: uracil phosphoribosyltransferase [Crocosphaera sp.]|nr:uracil phosphoribosyltransferase [Crocosphaera sp.]
MPSQLRVYVPDHPLIKHWLAIARDVNTPGVLFKTAMSELGRWLTYEATRYWFPTLDTTLQTPLATCQGTLINPEVPIAIIPILRAGLSLLDGAQTLLPLASIYHLGLARNEETLDNHCYLNKLPEKFAANTQIIILEPMLATGGSIMKAMDEIARRGADISLIRIISVVAAPPALQQLNTHYASLNIYTAIIDEGLNEKGYIVPGLGDAGDRAFGT